MLVKALEAGFFEGRRIRADQEFDVPEGTKGKWFVPVGEAAVLKGKPVKKAVEAQTLSEAGTQKAKSFTEAMKQGSDLA